MDLANLNLDSFVSSNDLENEIEKIIKRCYSSTKYPVLGKNEIKETTDSERLVFTSYFKTLNKFDDNEKIKVAEYYYEEVSKLDISSHSKSFCLFNINFPKNLMIYLEYDKINANKPNNSLKSTWSRCAHRECFDCCMYRKSQELANSNWIDKALFLANPHYEVGKWTVSCLWDCNFGDYTDY